MRRIVAPLSLILLALVACSSDDGPSEPQTGDLVVNAQSLSSTALLAPSAAELAAGDPTSFTMTFYAFYLAENADCTSARLVTDLAVSGVTYDLLTEPTLFTATGDPGTYNCAVLRISDVLQFTSATTFGPCVAGSSYQTDVYRDGESDWRDVAGTSLVGHGTDSSPVNDRPDVFFTTDRAAVLARGYSPNQVQSLVNPAVIPGTSTFAYDVTNAVADEGGHCRILPGTYEFR